MVNLLIDLYQQNQINDALRKSEKAQGKVDVSSGEIHDLKRKADALTIACQALWEIVQEKMGIEESVILSKMQEIDARDGRVDGKISISLLVCKKCKRKSNAKRSNCLYCGDQLEGGHVFEKG